MSKQTDSNAGVPAGPGLQEYMPAVVSFPWMGVGLDDLLPIEYGKGDKMHVYR